MMADGDLAMASHLVDWAMAADPGSAEVHEVRAEVRGQAGRNLEPHGELRSVVDANQDRLVCHRFLRFPAFERRTLTGFYRLVG